MSVAYIYTIAWLTILFDRSNQLKGPNDARMEIATAISAFAGLGITAAQIYTNLSTLAYQIRFARDQILRIAQDVSGVETAIQQLTELLKDEEISKSVDSDNKSLRLIQNLRISCQRLLEEIDKGLKEASKQIKGKGLSPGVEVTLSPAEQALWPFHRDKVDPMLRDLDAMRSTLILVSQMTTLSLMKRLAVGFVCLMIDLFGLTGSPERGPKVGLQRSMRMTKSCCTEPSMLLCKIHKFRECSLA